MISSLEVGSTFRILDEASPTIAKIADSLKLLQGQVDKTAESFRALASSSFTSLTNRIDKLAGSLEKVQGASTEIAGNLDRAMTSVAGSITAVGDSIGSLTSKIAQLNAELAASGKGAAQAAATAASTVASGAPASIRARQTGGDKWLHASGRAAVPGGHIGLSGPGGLAAMAAGVTVGWGIDDEMKVEDQAAMSAYISGDPWAKANADEAIKEYRDIATSAALKGSANPIDVATAMHRASNLLSGTMDYRKMLGLEQAVLPYAIGEARAKGISVEESMTSMIEGVHQAGLYDPASVESFMKDFQFAGAITPVSMPTFVRALGYSQAQLRTMGISDSETAIMATAALQRGGITNTRSGTWLRDYYQQLLPNGKDKHDAALKEMGLIDEQGKPTWHSYKADGSEDYRQELLNQSTILNQFTDKEKALGDEGKETINRDIQSAFGKQGGSFAAFLGDDAFRKQIGNLSGALTGYQGGDQMLDWLKKNDPLFQAQETWREFQKTMMDLGEALKGPLLATLKDIDGLLKVLDPTLSGLAKVLSFFTSQPQPGVNPKGDLNPFTNGFLGPLSPWTQPQSWDGSTAGLLHKISYGSGGSLVGDGVFRTGDDMNGPIMVAQTVDMLAENVNVAGAGGSGFGGGIMKASYEAGSGLTGSSGGLHSGGGYTVLGGGSTGAGGAPTGSSAGSLTALIDQVSAEAGIDPRIMEGIRAGESGHGSNYDRNLSGGDESYGPFQLNIKHPGDLGSEFQRETGLDVRDPRTIVAQARWVANYIKHTGNLSPWAGFHGLRDADPRWGNSGYFAVMHAATSPPTTEDYPGSDFSHRSHTVHAAAMNVASSGGGHETIQVNSTIAMDGRHVATAVQKHIVKRNRQVMGPSRHDGMGHLTPVDAGYQFER